MGLFSSETCGFEGCFRDERGGGVGKSQTARGWVQDCGGCDSHKVSGVLTVTAPPAPRPGEAPEPRTGHRRPAVCAGWACAVSSSTLSWFYSTYWATSRREPWRAVSRPPPAGSLLGPGCHTRHQQSHLGQTETGRRRVAAELGQLCAFLLPLVPPLPRWPPGPSQRASSFFRPQSRPRRRAGPRLGRAVARALTCGTSSPSFRRCNTSGSTAGGSLPGCRGSSAEKRRPLHRTRRAQACGERPGRRPRGARGAAAGASASPAGRAGSRAPSARPVCQLQALATDPVPHSSITQARATPE